jgi:hypothetical protein
MTQQRFEEGHLHLDQHILSSPLKWGNQAHYHSYPQREKHFLGDGDGPEPYLSNFCSKNWKEATTHILLYHGATSWASRIMERKRHQRPSRLLRSQRAGLIIVADAEGRRWGQWEDYEMNLLNLSTKEMKIYEKYIIRLVSLISKEM